MSLDFQGTQSHTFVGLSKDYFSLSAAEISSQGGSGYSGNHPLVPFYLIDHKSAVAVNIGYCQFSNFSMLPPKKIACDSLIKVGSESQRKAEVVYVLWNFMHAQSPVSFFVYFHSFKQFPEQKSSNLVRHIRRQAR